MASQPVQETRYGTIFTANYLGLVFEAYDLTIYAFLVGAVSQHFHVPVWYSFLVLSMTYVFRGVGGLFFGHVADRMGRRNALVLTVLGYSICTFLTGLSWSVLSLVVFRGLSGFFIGGEYVSQPYTMEVVPSKTRGFFSGLLTTSYSVGFLLASATFLVVTNIAGASFAAGNGWRWPFFVGILPALIALWLRLGVQESPAWLKVAAAHAHERRVPFFEVFRRRYIGVTIHAWLLAAALIWSYDALILAFPHMLSLLGVSAGGVGQLGIITNLGSMLGSLLGGVASQRWGRKQGYIASAVGGMLFTPLFVPIFVPHPGYFYLACFGFIGAIFAEAGFGIAAAFFAERFPTEVRATGATGTYNLGQIIAGWSTTLMAAMFPGGLQAWMHAMIINALVAFAVLIFFTAISGKDTRAVDLGSFTEAGSAAAGS